MAVDHGTARTANQTLALAFGAVYTLVGLAGFLVSETFAGRDDDTLLGFEVNNLHNLVHLLIGLTLLAASKRLDSARTANLVIGGTYLLLGLVGWSLDDTKANVIAANSADHVLHLSSGALLTGVALAADKHARTRAHR